MNSGNRGCLGCLVILMGMLVCGGIVYLTVDRVCYAGITRRVPVYPDVTTIRTTHNMLFEYGMGTTVGIYESVDDPETVRRWYATHMREYMRADAVSSSPLTSAQVRLTQARWDVTEAEDGTGSQIILFGQCAN
ncbi:MAG: hypothetical protein JNL34_04985 [Anaerolineae bacterium]|nr:hypothetical protein [Anaerolineae bacterium]